MCIYNLYLKKITNTDQEVFYFFFFSRTLKMKNNKIFSNLWYIKFNKIANRSLNLKYDKIPVLPDRWISLMLHCGEELKILKIAVKKRLIMNDGAALMAACCSSSAQVVSEFTSS